MFIVTSGKHFFGSKEQEKGQSFILLTPSSTVLVELATCGQVLDTALHVHSALL